MLQFEMLSAQPIPIVKAPLGWKDVVIIECGESLVALSSLQNTRIIVEPEYFQKGLSNAIEEVYVREGVAHRLSHAASQLPAGYSLLVWDAWRPFSLQQGIFDKHYQELREQFSSLSEDEVCRRAEVYVSLPSKDIRRPSPHYTGGAIDLTIAGPDGQPLPMDTGFDSFNSRSRTRVLEEYLEKGEKLTEEEGKWLHNRRVLYHIMITSGFTNYCEEWWHFDYGNQFWGAVTSRNAFYGGTEPHSFHSHFSSR